MKAWSTSLLVIPLTVSLSVKTSWADGIFAEKLDCGLGYSILISQVEQLRHTETSTDGWRVFSTANGLQIFSVAPPDIDASPFIARRTAFEMDGAWYSRTDACGYGDHAAGKELIEKFGLMDNYIKQQIERAGSAPSEVNQ